MKETESNTDEKPTRNEIVDDLQTGNRNIVDDGADIYETNHNNIEVRHETGDVGWKNVDVHDLRRSWATHVLGEGVLPSVVMSWGGWHDWETFRKHYLGEFSPEVLERERQKVEFLADGDTLDAKATSNNLIPSSSSTYADD